MTHLMGWVLAGILVTVTVGIHYEIIRLVSDIVMPWAMKRFHDRRVMMLTIVTLMFGHIVEIWIFAAVMMGVALYPHWGSVSGDFDGSLNAFIYLSAISYTSIGFGEMFPHGWLRAIAASEALTGLLMIAWSASFTYLKMEQIWNRRKKNTASSAS